ncbi:MAG TPA: GNAT family N-acetyltransferase [Burkholderiaceae bacterium]|nr:GNAT family N-acetyltransferase [Burkholderiaceae bacterium]
MLTFTPLTPERRADYLEFFDTRAFTDNPRWAGCYCYFPLHDPAHVRWEARGTEENRTAVSACIADGSARGVLAYHSGKVVGWCNAGPWSQYPMLRDVDAPDAESLGAIFCFIVAPEWRGQGVARGLLDAACRMLQTLGLRDVQARPLKSAKGSAANHLGPLAMYLAAGFSVLREEDDGTLIVRRSLRDKG